MLRSCKQHPSAGCCLPFTAYRTSIGNKWTRFSRKNNNTKIHRSNIICPISDACTAVRCYLDGAGFVLGITFCMRECRGRPMCLPDIVPVFYGHFLIVYLLTHFAICAPRGTTNAVLRVTIHSKIRR